MNDSRYFLRSHGSVIGQYLAIEVPAKGRCKVVHDDGTTGKSHGYTLDFCLEAAAKGELVEVSRLDVARAARKSEMVQELVDFLEKAT